MEIHSVHCLFGFANIYNIIFLVLEKVALIKIQEAELVVAEVKMYSLGVKKMDRIPNEHIRGKAQIDILEKNLERPD